MSQLYANQLGARTSAPCGSRRTGCAALLLALLVTPLCADRSALAGPGDDERAVQAVIRDYEAAWSRHDAHAIASFYFEPAMRVSAAGPSVRETRAVQEAVFSGLLQRLAQRGYATSVLQHLEVHLLDVDTAIASGVVMRDRPDGSVLETLGATWLLWRTTEGWKIFLSTNHDPEAAVHFKSACGPGSAKSCASRNR